MTFDGPLGTYTPFGLTGTGARIIAPFFADVDTRAGQTVTYGWGNTTYEGHRAFCANWINVGYFAGHTDKTNSFQLLIVQREDTGVPGDFDIVFNYERVAWETGDASGGVGGLGGSSARAGFSNGSGVDGTSYELAGSGVNGGLLDSNAQTGLTNYMTTSTLNNTTQVVPGRHVFPVRSGGAPLTNYVALGDSYQSGEGAGDYLAGTDTDIQQVPPVRPRLPAAPRGPRCREPDARLRGLQRGQDLRPRRRGVDDRSAVGRRGLAVRASQQRHQAGHDRDRRQQPGLLRDPAGLHQVGADGPVLTQDTCQHQFDQRLQDNWATLTDGKVLEGVYREIRARAPYARVAVLGYPRFYVEGGHGNRYDGEFCGGLRLTDQIWVNAGIKRLDDHIRDAAGSLGLQYVDTYDAPDGHELCGPSDEHFMNGIKLTKQVESYHPNQYGHSVLADEVARALLALPPGELFNVRPGQTLNYQFPVDGAGSTPPPSGRAATWCCP